MKPRWLSILMVIVLATGIYVALPAKPASADTAGPKYPATGTDVSGVGTITWSNPDRIVSDDNSYAAAAVNNSTSHYLRGTDYGFAIPAGATIDGVTVTIGRYGTTGFGRDIRDNVVRLVKNGSVVGDNKAVTGTDWGNTETAVNYGGATDKWGETWTPADINSTDFGVVLSVTSTNQRTAYVDYIRVTVTYTYTPVYYTITSSAGSGGSISPLGNTSVAEGGSQTYTITPGSGYVVGDVVVDGVSKGVTTSYTFDNVQADHSISATFVEMPSSGTGTHTCTTSGNRVICTYTSGAGTFIPSQNMTVDYLVVAGGGGGGGVTSGISYGAGGGGAGAMRDGVLALTGGQSYDITVGAGGSGASCATSCTAGTNGGDSKFATMTSTGGGRGAYKGDDSGAAGGSGGGARNNGTAGTGTTGGNDGGKGSTSGGAGGGGGADAVGGAASGTGGAAGGRGRTWSITGQVYAGGGGGGGYGAAGGAGGSGGGGAGGPTARSAGTNGAPNTGGAGGGATGSSSGSAFNGGNGGSGVVIVSYTYKASQTITFAPLADKTYGDTDFPVSAAASSGLTVSFTSPTPSTCTVSGNTVHIVAAGTCTIRASQAGDSNYNAAPDVGRSFEINKATQTITFAPLGDKTYGDADFDVSATGGGSGNPVTFTSRTESTCTVNVKTVHIKAAGTCTIRASQAGDSNYNAALDVDRSFTINKATPTATLSVTNSPVIYDGQPHAAAVTISSSSVPGSVVNVLTGGQATRTAKGTYAVTADFVPTDSANYNTLTGLSAGNFVIRDAGTFTSRMNGNWTIPETWEAYDVPTPADSVVIAENTTVTVNSDSAIVNVTIDSQGTLDLSGHNLTVAGNWANNGTLTHSNGTVTFNGTTTISGSAENSFNNVTIDGSLTAPGANMNVAGDWTDNGTFAHNNGTVTFNGSGSQTIGGSATTQTFYGLTVNKSGGSIATVSGPTTLNIDGNLAIAAGKLDAGTAADINIKGSATNSSTDVAGTKDPHTFYGFIPGAGTVTFNGSGAPQQSRMADAFSAEAPAAGVHSPDAPMACQQIGGPSNWYFNNLTIVSNTCVDQVGYVYVAGNLVVQANAALNLSASDNLWVAGTVTNNGAISQTKTVSGATPFVHITSLLGAVKYEGVDITPTAGLGSTTVTVYGNQECAQPPMIGSGGVLIKRCYTIAPATANPATVRLWFADSGEMNALGLGDIEMLREKVSPPTWEKIYTTTGGPTNGFSYVQGTVTSYGRFSAGKYGPNLVSLDYFTATQQGAKVVLAWATLSEIDSAGFNVWRGESPEGPYVRFNIRLLPARGGPLFGATYQITDFLGEPDRAYYYKLEEVDLYGVSTFYGPASTRDGM